MPRKSRKAASQKCPLQFLEAPLDGARLQKVPEVRAALNPRSFTTETQRRNVLTSWVRPQFEQSHLAAPPPSRGRRRCQSTTSVLGGTSQLTRKSKFPSLSFQEGARDKSHQPRCRKKATETPLASGPVCQRTIPGQGAKTVPLQNAQEMDTPKRQSASLQKRNSEDSELHECAATSSRRSGPHPIREVAASPPAPAEPHSPDVRSVFTPPNVDTPEWDNTCPSSRFQDLLQPSSEMSTPPNHLTKVLAEDTPERDYGVRVTWRRRRDLMMLLKDKGFLH